MSRRIFVSLMHWMLESRFSNAALSLIVLMSGVSKHIVILPTIWQRPIAFFWNPLMRFLTDVSWDMQDHASQVTDYPRCRYCDWLDVPGASHDFCEYMLERERLDEAKWDASPTGYAGDDNDWDDD